MTNIKEFLLEKIQKHSFLKTVPQSEIEKALSTCLNIFGDTIKPVFNGILELKSRKKHTQAVDVLDDALPALMFAHKHFGDTLPHSLVQKLQNPTQTTDTFFELKCLGVFREKHGIIYEPKLRKKIPDFKIVLQKGQEIYVECKVQHGDQEAQFARVFKRVTDEICAAIEKAEFVSSAWTQGLRTEIVPTKTVDGKEVKALAKALEEISPSECLVRTQVTTNIVVICIPREQPSRIDNSMRQGMIRVGDKPTRIGHENTHLMIHSWAGLDTRRRKSQRKLLAEARKKLRDLPSGSLGLICIQTFSARLFLPDIEKLMEQKEYDQVPLVWLNPFNEGQIVCRNQYLELRNRIFQEMVKTSA